MAGVALHCLEVRDTSGFGTAFAAMARDRAEALVVLSDPLFFDQATTIQEFAAKRR